MNAPTEEILDFENEKKKRKPTFARLSFALGIIVIIMYGYIYYWNSHAIRFQENLSGGNSVAIVRNKLIITFVYSFTYFLSLIFLIVSIVRKEKSILKILAVVGHVYVFISFVLTLL